VKTEELVRLIAADRTVQPSPGRQLSAALVPGFAIAFVLFLELAGWRPDLLPSLASPRFVFKLALNLALALVAGALVLRLARPQSRTTGLRWMLGLLGAMLLAAVAAELAVLPRAQWWETAKGENATWCLRIIPTLALAPLVFSLAVLRRAAPGRPALAGAAAGLLAAGIGGFLYGTHCPDDSPLFVALWYSCATATVVAMGALAGSRVLRW
jgi:hypothetical protein